MRSVLLLLCLLTLPALSAWQTLVQQAGLQPGVVFTPTGLVVNTPNDAWCVPYEGIASYDQQNGILGLQPGTDYRDTGDLWLWRFSQPDVQAINAQLIAAAGLVPDPTFGLARGGKANPPASVRAFAPVKPSLSVMPPASALSRLSGKPCVAILPEGLVCVTRTHVRGFTWDRVAVLYAAEGSEGNLLAVNASPDLSLPALQIARNAPGSADGLELSKADYDKALAAILAAAGLKEKGRETMEEITRVSYGPGGTPVRPVADAVYPLLP